MICICGISGLLGRELSIYFDSINVKYIGTYNHNKINCKNEIFKYDFHNEMNYIKFEQCIKKYNITVIIFCIVERYLEICENNWNSIKKTNIDIVHNISIMCNKYDIKFIHFSTDYVFDGFTQPNSPNSIINPLQNYGISKYISECRVISNCNNYCIIRTPVLYSSNSRLLENAVCTIGKKCMDLRINKKYTEDNYSIRRPVYIPDLCVFINNVIRNNNIGIYHFYNPINKYTKYEICKIVSNTLNCKMDNIYPINTQSTGNALRPYDTQLTDDKYDIKEYIFTEFRQSINECFERYRKEKISKDLFICIDLDGTLIDSNDIHYRCYEYALKKVGDILSNEKWNEIIQKDNINSYLQSKYDIDTYNEIKRIKYDYMNYELVINYTKNSEEFIKYLCKNDINFCIVTNASKNSVECFKNKLPLLNEIKNWICREDYIQSKPESDCYKEAIKRYYKNENRILCIEDSENGYLSAKNITDYIYIYNNENVFNKYDCYIFDDYKELID